MELVGQRLHPKGNLLDLFGRRVEFGARHEIRWRTASIEGAIVASGGETGGREARGTETSHDRRRSSASAPRVVMPRWGNTVTSSAAIMELASPCTPKGARTADGLGAITTGTRSASSVAREGSGEHASAIPTPATGD